MKKIKQIIILLLALLINVAPINASTKTYERTEQNKYLLIILRRIKNEKDI